MVTSRSTLSFGRPSPPNNQDASSGAVFPPLLPSESECRDKTITQVYSDDIASILPPAKPDDFEMLYIQANAFRPVGDAAKPFDFKSCRTPKRDEVRYLNENHFKSHSWLVYSRAHRGLYCKVCAIFASSKNTFAITNNCEKPGNLEQSYCAPSIG